MRVILLCHICNQVCIILPLFPSSASRSLGTFPQGKAFQTTIYRRCSMKRLLITGFDPFGGESVNPSWEAVSNSAGAFVCNDVLYTLLHHYAGTSVRVGFVHL